MSYLPNKEYIEIINVEGIYLAYFKGEVLPAQIESTVFQKSDGESGCITEATIKFQVKPEVVKKDIVSFNINGETLVGIIKNNDSDKTHLM